MAQQKQILAANPNVEASKLFKAEEKSTKTTIPFVKKNEFDYAHLVTWISPGLEKYAWIIFIFRSSLKATSLSKSSLSPSEII